MNFQENKDRNPINRQSRRRRIILTGAILIVVTIILLFATFDRMRELGDRVINPIDLLPLLEIPNVYDIQGYPAASERAFTRFLKQDNNRHLFSRLKVFLQANQVHKVVSPFELLRQGSDWRDLNEPPFAIPPEEYWKTVVDTLKVIRQEIVPRIGPVTVLSGWRTASYNRKAGGSKGSKHLLFCGLDVVPQKNFSREQLVPVLRDIHRRNGRPWKMGLGIYKSIRFHVDTCGYRRW
ncbi:D-Ala-D-Ala carboxypeptidase family metallohydrolase [Microbulbifer sp. 2205BS26-8]|uniref:D-Ala-D-Ala carboxypeptidase family metallohydrolase n=1 Tax=Microbulbifer sp. 2205BS26-8 TaxID=3064386 RepID=UPI00273F4817|nr:D-Ala-D-Ala carboxypeptidase family metallohydrolase [Microbulbifer sp. 2205BS26-8]MDP5209692.1 D-Ala-D-Ala carboxypeptidase family metallohydrolase [Microbulbifer sp. 2205BS26-8]